VNRAPREADEHQTRITERRDVPRVASSEDCLVIIFSTVPTDVGRRHVLKFPLTTIGRGHDNDIALQNDAVSRQHAKIERRGTDIMVVDLGSTNGTFVNDDPKPLNRVRLEPGDLLRIGDTVFKYLSGKDIETQYHLVISQMAMTDGLTNLCNRQRLDALLAEEINRARRYRRELSLLMLDVDHFKHINDTYGHPVGDSVLTRLAELLLQRLRPSDKLGRYGGEEFCAILPETPLSSASQIAESLRAMVAEQRLVAAHEELAVSVSIGVAELNPQMGAADLYRAADQMLYRAKSLGRNRVCC
jgi:two-component system, cell cycle response regulator